VPQGIGSFDSNHYNIVAISDFDGDHNADILFRSISGADVNGLFEWKIVNNQLAAVPFQVGSAPPGAHVVGIGDFNGDGTTDLLFRYDQIVGAFQPGQLAMWLLNSQGALLVAPSTVGAPIAANWHVDGTGDLNGDGRSDIILRDQDGQLRELLMNGFTIQTDQNVGTESQDFTIAAHHYNLV
jgi:serralysin